MALLSGGCAIYDFAKPNANLSTSSGFGTLHVKESIVERAVNIEVIEGERALISRRYDELFLDSQKSDEFTAIAMSGSKYLFRYWGSPDCTSTASNTP
ncbi:MAG: hypothetical protein ABJA82_06775 [Myxococcales bacterium]